MEWKAFNYPSLASTNDQARQIKERQAFWVRADFQSQGRGQQGRKWISPAGKNLLATYSIPMDLVVAKSLLSLNIGVLLADILKDFEVSIKWPNDLLINNRKVAGILIETFEERFLVGIGLNCNWPVKVLEQDGKLISSLKIEKGTKVDPVEIGEKIAAKLGDILPLPSQQILTNFKEKWQQKKQKIELSEYGIGHIRDVNQQGFLVVKLETGSEVVINSSHQIIRYEI